MKQDQVTTSIRGQTGKDLHFIVGVGRSGTTLLTRLLNRHPDIHCAPEADFLVFFLRRYQHVTSFTGADIELILQQIQIYALSHPRTGWHFDPEVVKARLTTYVNHTPRLSYQELCKMIYSQFEVEGMDKSGATVLVDKNPYYTMFVNRLSSHLPEAKFIWLVRDYRANVLSRKQNAYPRPRAVAYNASRWRYCNALAMRFYKKHRDKVLLLRYEDLVQDPDSSLQKVFSFLGIQDPEPDLVYEEELSIGWQGPEAMQPHKAYFQKKYSDLSRPVNATRVDAWQTELSAAEINTCDAICSRLALSFSYKAHTNMSAFQKMICVLGNLPAVISAIFHFRKDQLSYYLPIRFKMKRFIRHHQVLGFLSPRKPGKPGLKRKGIL